MMLALTPLLRHGILGASLVGVAAVANQIQIQ